MHKFQVKQSQCWFFCCFVGYIELWRSPGHLCLIFVSKTFKHVYCNPTLTPQTLWIDRRKFTESLGGFPPTKKSHFFHLIFISWIFRFFVCGLHFSTHGRMQGIETSHLQKARNQQPMPLPSHMYFTATGNHFSHIWVDRSGVNHSKCLDENMYRRRVKWTVPWDDRKWTDQSLLKSS